MTGAGGEAIMSGSRGAGGSAGRHYAAVDLGASSGRVIVGTVGHGELALTEVHRFANGPVFRNGGMHWDIENIIRQVQAGIRTAAGSAQIRSVGIDSWAVDYGLIDANGVLLDDPYHYRDPRGEAGLATVHHRIDPGRLFRLTGIQQLPINTVYQLATESPVTIDGAARMLMIPDLLAHRLAGIQVTEMTNASTTGLLDAARRTWSAEVMSAAGVRHSLMPPIIEAGTDLGAIDARDRAGMGLSESIKLVAVASHDTASAVAAVPASSPEIAYVSCGTWALVGVELHQPQTGPAAWTSGFTNEIGVDGTVRFLRNITGLWVLQEAVRAWRLRGPGADLGDLLAAAEALPAGGPVVDITATEFADPGDMTPRIRDACTRAGLRAPQSRAAIVRCILDSLAEAIARAVHDVMALTGHQVSVIHLVGGGARNRLLCQLVADAADLPLLAGPVEATAIGNLLVQARADGAMSGDLFALRDLVRRTHPPQQYRPSR